MRLIESERYLTKASWYAHFLRILYIVNILIHCKLLNSGRIVTDTVYSPVTTAVYLI